MSVRGFSAVEALVALSLGGGILISALGLLLLAAIVYLSSHWLAFTDSHTRFPSNQNYSLFLNRAPPQS